MKTEYKVAWLKSDPFNEILRRRLVKGQNISHAQLLAAVGDVDNRVVFGGNTASGRRKEDYVIFQYSVIIRRRNGDVALFDRAKEELGQERITAGPSLLLSSSSADTPEDALPRLLQNQICVNKRKVIGHFKPIGLVLNELPIRHGKIKPTYLFAIYEHILPDDVLLHGRFRELPDEFKRWLAPDKAVREIRGSGFTDEFIASHLLTKSRKAKVPHEGMIFAKGATVESPSIPKVRAYEYSFGRQVFISHCSKDSFAAYALYRILIDESERTLFPTVDLMQSQEGTSLSKMIKRFVSECDCLVLIITPTLLTEIERAKARKTKLWSEMEVRMAEAKGKPIIGFKLGTMEIPKFVSKDRIVNDRAEYCNWLNEIRELMLGIEKRFS